MSKNIQNDITIPTRTNLRPSPARKNYYIPVPIPQPTTITKIIKNNKSK